MSPYLKVKEFKYLGVLLICQRIGAAEVVLYSLYHTVVEKKKIVEPEAKALNLLVNLRSYPYQ